MHNITIILRIIVKTVGKSGKKFTHFICSLVRRLNHGLHISHLHARVRTSTLWCLHIACNLHTIQVIHVSLELSSRKHYNRQRLGIHYTFFSLIKIFFIIHALHDHQSLFHWLRNFILQCFKDFSQRNPQKHRVYILVNRTPEIQFCVFILLVPKLSVRRERYSESTFYYINYCLWFCSINVQSLRVYWWLFPFNDTRLMKHPSLVLKIKGRENLLSYYSLYTLWIIYGGGIKYLINALF